MDKTPRTDAGELERLVEDLYRRHYSSKDGIRAAILSYSRTESRKWRNDAIEAAADIAKRYDSNPHCVTDILGLRDETA